MAKNEVALEKRVALLEQELAEIKALLKEQIAKTQPAPAASAAVAAAAPVAPAATPTIKSVQPVEKKGEPAKEEGVSPEIMAVITAAVTHFRGLRARMRHTRLVQPAGVNPWAQQGRVFIQASHNLAHR